MEALKRKNDELKQTIEFLRLPTADDLDRFFSLPTDVVLHASDNIGPGVPAHRAILASRSPVFKAMLLQSEMKESRTGIINIEDVSHDVLHRFVHYLYTAEVSLDMELAWLLLKLADKYQVNLLSANCENFLVSKLTGKNALMCFASASRHNALRLREASVILLEENFEKVTEQEGYQELVDSDPKLVVLMYEAVHDYKSKSKACDQGMPVFKRLEPNTYDDLSVKENPTPELYEPLSTINS